MELQKLETFHAKLILYLQTITLMVDTKDRSEHIATLTNVTNAGLVRRIAGRLLRVA